MVPKSVIRQRALSHSRKAKRARRTPLWRNLLCISLLVACPFLLLGTASAAKAPDNNTTPNNSIVEGPVIGIDLGTTYSCVAVLKNGRVEIIPNAQGNRITPSWVSFPVSGDPSQLVGDAAKNAFSQNPTSTIFDIKRLIGRSYNDKDVQADLKHFPFKVVNQKGMPRVSVVGGKRKLSPEEVSAMVLREMKETAERYLGEEVKNAVVTVPAYFTDAQRAATRDAGTIAGLNVVRIVNEPTAAALAYGLDSTTEGEEKTVIVYDLGGGTFDVSVLVLDDGVFEVLATAGDTHLGGEDFDNRVMKYLVGKYQSKTGTDVSANAKALSKLKREVERAKRVLSSQASTKLDIEAFESGNDYSETLTRAKFEELNADLFRKTLKPVAQVLKDAKLTEADVTDVVLVGGSTRIPKIQQMLEEYFGKAPSQGINPDEAVAYGAAIQGGILTGENSTSHITLIDVNPLTLGIETTGGVMSTLIKRGSNVPNKVAQIFSTAADGQTTVDIQIFEGERALTRHNNLLGRFRLRGVAPAPRGTPQIEVTFELDANGILKVSAADKATGQSESIEITNDKSRLSPEELQCIIDEAEKWAQDDKEIKDKIEARNQLEAYAFSVKHQMEDEQASEHMDQSTKVKITTAIKETLDWLETQGERATLEDIEEQREVLQGMLNNLHDQAVDDDRTEDAGDWTHNEL